MRTVLIEFTEDTKDSEGNVKRAKGSQLRVDPLSAKSFVETKKVAKLVGDTESKADARQAVKSAALPDGSGGAASGDK